MSRALSTDSYLTGRTHIPALPSPQRAPVFRTRFHSVAAVARHRSVNSGSLVLRKLREQSRDLGAPPPPPPVKHGKSKKSKKEKKSKAQKAKKNQQAAKAKQNGKQARLLAIGAKVRARFVPAFAGSLDAAAAEDYADERSALRMDSLVGDRLCQVYALLIAYGLRRGLALGSAAHEIEPLLLQNAPLRAVNADPFVDDAQAFAFLMNNYFLSMFPKKLGVNHRCNFMLDRDVYAREFEATANWVEVNCIRGARKCVNAQAVNWCVETLTAEGTPFLPPRNKAFTELTCYDSFRFVVDNAIANDVPFVLSVSRVCTNKDHWHYFRLVVVKDAEDGSLRFEDIDDVDLLPTTPVLVLDGDAFDGPEGDLDDFSFAEAPCFDPHACADGAAFHQRLMGYDVRNLLLANAAIYDDDHGFENDVSPGYPEALAFAREVGCGIEHMGAFVIRHIFCNLFGEQRDVRERFQRLTADCEPAPIVPMEPPRPPPAAPAGGEAAAGAGESKAE